MDTRFVPVRILPIVLGDIASGRANIRGIIQKSLGDRLQVQSEVLATRDSIPNLLEALADADLAIVLVGLWEGDDDPLPFQPFIDAYDQFQDLPTEAARPVKLGLIVWLTHPSGAGSLREVLAGKGVPMVEAFDYDAGVKTVYQLIEELRDGRCRPISMLARTLGERLAEEVESDAPRTQRNPPPNVDKPKKKQASSKVPATDDEETESVSFSGLQSQDFTEGAWAVLDVARRLGESRSRPDICSVRRLMASLCLWGQADKQAPHSGRWLVEQLNRQESSIRDLLSKEYAVIARADGTFHGLLGSDLEMANRMTPRLNQTIELARRLALESNPGQSDRRIAARHLLGAALVRANSRTNVERFLENLGLDMAGIRRKLIRQLPSWGVPDNPEVYLKILDPVETPSEERGLPVYAADAATGPDLIGITREVEAMASLVSAWSVEPPLSIGLFGEWGSGKSFFMEKMRDRVWQIAAEARKSKLGQREFGYYRNIVQVEFNAWHYLEGNLWASLVEHIFNNLRFTGGGAPDIDSEEHIKLRLEKLLSEVKGKSAEVDQKEQKAILASKEAEQKTEEANKKAEMLDKKATGAQERATRLEEERQEAAKKAVEKQRQADASTLERDSIGLKDIFEKVSESSGVRKAFEEDLGKLGITQDRLKSAQGLQEAIKEASSAGAILHQGIEILRRDGRRWWLLGWVVATPVAVAALVWAGAYLTKSQDAPWMQSILGIVSAVATVVGGIVGVWKRYAPKLKPVLDAVGRIKEKRADLDRQMETLREARAARAVELDAEVQAKQADAAKQKETAEKLAAEAAQARQEAENTRKAAEQAAAEAQSAKAELDKLRADAEALRPERRIAAFIQDRAGAQDYRKHLGVPALIRRDFEKLSAMFRTQRTAEEANRDGNNTADQNDLAIVNRIILYIDDLDRCSPEKVVEVLRAIHLLLAFPLFVVIVAVDARWMKRSLRNRFDLMLSEKADPDSQTDFSPMATPDDYLEKIFQVPFWIRPLNPKACQDLVNALTRDVVETPAVDPGHMEAVPSPPPLNPLVPPTVSRAAVGTVKPPEDVAGGTNQPGGAGIPPGASPLPPSPASPADLRFKWSPIQPKPRALQLTKEEREYMAELAPLIGRSPRSVKRFVNCYRLLKSALDPNEQARVANDGTFRSTMLLLGLVTGLPDVAPALLTHLRQSDPSLSPVAWIGRAAKSMNLDQRPYWPELQPVVHRLEKSVKVASIQPLAEAAKLVDRFSFSPIRAPVSAIIPKKKSALATKP